ncbi:MAG: helix-turn-helix domain-containing protein [Planctomycetota bacterium]
MNQSQVARRLKIGRDFVRSIAARTQFRCSHQHLTVEQRDRIRRMREVDGRTIRDIAKELGLPPSTVGGWSRRFLESVEDEGGTAVKPVRLRIPRRCPVHGLVDLWPCVACQAEKN